MSSYPKMHSQSSQHGMPSVKSVREPLYKSYQSNMKKIDRWATSRELEINKQHDAMRARAESRYKNPGLFGICILTRNLTAKMEKIERARERALRNHRQKVEIKRAAQEIAITIIARSWLYRLA